MKLVPLHSFGWCRLQVSGHLPNIVGEQNVGRCSGRQNVVIRSIRRCYACDGALLFGILNVVVGTVQLQALYIRVPVFVSTVKGLSQLQKVNYPSAYNLRTMD